MTRRDTQHLSHPLAGHPQDCQVQVGYVQAVHTIYKLDKQKKVVDQQTE